jgi:hypothetical protein
MGFQVFGNGSANILAILKKIKISKIDFASSLGRATSQGNLISIRHTSYTKGVSSFLNKLKNSVH